MKKQTAGLHKVALAALFTVGNALLRYPWRQSDTNVLFLFLLSVVGALLPAFLLYPVFRRIWRKPVGKKKSRLFGVALLSVLFAVYALYCAWRSCADYVDFSVELVLPRGNRFLLTALFLACAVGLSRLTDKGMDSFSLLAFIGVVLCAVFLFVVGIPHFQITHLRADLFVWDVSVLESVPTLWKESLLPLTVLSLYFALTVPRGGERSLALGTGIGCVILFLCVLQAILTFGTAYAAQLTYPYSYATRILSVGQYFFRLEGFSYLLDYASCLLRCAVSLALAKRLLGRFAPRIAHGLPICVGVILLACSVFL